MSESDQKDIMHALHDHDRRLVAVETEMRGIHNEIRGLKDDIRENATVAKEALAKIVELAVQVSDLAASHKMLLRFLGVSVSMLVLLEAYAVLLR